MSTVVSMRLKDEQLSRLKRYARSLGKSPSEVSALIVEERLREEEFALIEFRGSPIGRQAYMKGSRLPVWWVVHTVQTGSMRIEQAAEHFHRPLSWVKAAMNYYASFPDEIGAAIDDHAAASVDSLRRALPGIQMLEVRPEEVG